MRIIYVPKPVSGFYPVKYGLLYNWYAATDARNIAASGWHVPNLTEYTTLVNYVGGNMVAGGKLKETGLTYWLTPNTSATNEYGINTRGGGNRSYASGGTFGTKQGVSNFLMSNNVGTLTTYTLNIRYNTAHVGAPGSYEIGYLLFKADGSNVRLIKDSTTLAHGQTGTYTGNDGKTYRTICIGTQEWLADNLAETKYRNGDAIPEVTDNTAWTALTTGAMCAYNNDHNNI